MAEGVLFTVAGEILMKLSSEASQRLGMVFGLKDDLAKFNSNVTAIQSVLVAAEKRPTENVPLQDWLSKLKEVLYDAEDVLDELSYAALQEVMTRGNIAKQVRIFFSKSNSIAFNYRMASKIRNIWKKLDAIAVERNQFQLPEIFEQSTQYGFSFHPIMAEKETSSLLNQEEVVGRDWDKNSVKNTLLNMNVKHNVSFIAIVGIGGIGKTTLAKSLYNNEQVSQNFDLKIWVWVSDRFEINTVVEKIIESATKSNPNVKGKEALQGKLQEVIQGKKYLLVMDDVWNESENKWNELKHLLMGGAKGSKIMITKRDGKLAASIANITSLFHLKGMSQRESWSLFRTVAFEEGQEPTNQNFKQLGEEILDKCGGVPLLIRHIGRALLCQKTLEEWRFFKDNELSKVNQKENETTSILKLSYNYLSSNLKQCFAYSSLYTKNEHIDKDELIRQWVAHGFFESPNRSKSMEDIGNEYFRELCWRFFYEYHDNGDLRIHDVMHDLARMVGGNGYVCGNLNNDDVGEKIHHVSFGVDIESWNDLPSKLLEAKGLRTFHKRLGNKINGAVLDKLFCSFPCLRVLNLSHSNIKIVPDSLKKLRHLRYLNLSENRDMKLLPNCIGELLYLQTLNLNGCHAIKELPRDIKNLVNLRHLDLLGLDQLTHMPKGIGKLTCLQTLHIFVLDNNKHGSKISELSELNELRGELYIKGLEQSRGNPSEASLANLKGKKGLRDLILEWKPSLDEYKGDDQDELNDEKVLEGLEPHPNVEWLSIWRYKGVGFPNWFSNSLLINLTDISIVECNRVQHLPQLDQLPALKNLYLRDITSLEYFFIDKKKKNLPSSSSSVFFPCLEILILENMPNLEGWWEGESTVLRDGESEIKNGLLPIFACLTRLWISMCPKLGWVPRLPTLKHMKLEGVGAKMVSSIASSSNLLSVILKNIEDLEYLPITLKKNDISGSLEIWNCPNFISVQEWVLTSFVIIEIINCPKLKSLPKKENPRVHIENCPQIEATFKEGVHWLPADSRKEAQEKTEHGIRTRIPSIFHDFNFTFRQKQQLNIKLYGMKILNPKPN